MILLWLFCLSVALIVVSTRFEDLSVTALSSRLDRLDSTHSENHLKAVQRIADVDSSHKETVMALGNTVQQVDLIQGKVKNTFREMKYFLTGLAKVAQGAATQLEELEQRTS